MVDKSQKEMSLPRQLPQGVQRVATAGDRLAVLELVLDRVVDAVLSLEPGSALDADLRVRLLSARVILTGTKL